MVRKTGIKLLAGAVQAAVLVLMVGCVQSTQKTDFQSKWTNAVDRTWVGPEYWANRLQDWRVENGRLECVEGSSRKPMRTVHLLTRRLGTEKGSLKMSVLTGPVSSPDKISPEARTGFLVGVGKGLDYRAAALVHHSYGAGAGLFAGIDTGGSLFINDFAVEDKILVSQGEGIGIFKSIELKLTARPEGEDYSMTLSACSPETGEELSSLTLGGIKPDRLEGNLALVSHSGSDEGNNRFWFQNWYVSGSKVEVYEDRICGPILSTQYTLSHNVMKTTAQMMPVGQMDTKIAVLEIIQDGKWIEIAKANVVELGFTAIFRVEDWDSSKDFPYRVRYDLKFSDGSSEHYFRYGTIRHDPLDKETIILAAFTGNHNLGHGFKGADSGTFPWADRVWFPHKDLTDKVAKHRPDVLFFSGDQVYEGASPTSPDRSSMEKAHLDYLYKWYLWCWAYRDLIKDIPSVTIPDDHDVYQGNLWGAAGRKTDKDNRGGYIMPAEWINMVQRTQTGHLPDPYDPTPIEQGIGVYYCAMNYGRISFAVIEDRKFKSGPSGLAPRTKSGRADHVIDPNFDPGTADVLGAKLLGERQLKFLEEWAADWRDTDMKVVLSQTVFANATSLHGPNETRLVADYDSNGWPQTGRNAALHKFRKAFATHVSGDQHLATIIHYGIDDWDDAGWSLCVPSVANFYPRSWLPLEPGKDREQGMPDYTGKFLDGLGNHITVWAAANPRKPTGKEPAALHDRMPGYGIVRLNKKDRTITFECWPRYADPADPKTGGQYLGWPKTVSMEGHYGRKAAAYLPTVNISGMIDPVVQVIDEANNEIVYTLRIKGTSFRPKVFKEGMYTIKIGEPGTDKMNVLKNISSMEETQTETLEVVF